MCFITSELSVNAHTAAVEPFVEARYRLGRGFSGVERTEPGDLKSGNQTIPWGLFKYERL